MEKDIKKNMKEKRKIHKNMKNEYSRIENEEIKSYQVPEGLS